ncbi:MAG: cell division protein FtsZ [Lentisphaerae bacterium]|nr:cell division protein FtsZ [Lentisphaerota bacterium]
MTRPGDGQRTRTISIVGVGGGGCKIVDCMAGDRPRMLATAAVNTDEAELSASSATTKLQIGAAHTGGHGTGGDARLAARAAADDLHMIRNLFTGAELAIVVAGLGGGVGTGAAPVILKAARDAGAATICLATVPFHFEGGHRRDRAEAAIVDLLGATDALIVVQNDRLLEAVDKAAIAEALAEGDRVLGASLNCLWKLVAQPGFIALDFADLRRLVRGSGGMCTMAYGEGTGRDRARRAVAAVLEGPLMARGKVVAEAKSLLVSIVGGADLMLQEVGDIVNAIKRKAGADAEIEVGTAMDDALRGRVALAVIASELRSAPDAEAEADGDAKPDVPPSRKPADAGEPRSRERRRRGEPKQTRLNLETAGRGRFKDTEPTMLDGQDLDVPTFVRRGIRVER